MQEWTSSCSLGRSSFRPSIDSKISHVVVFFRELRACCLTSNQILGHGGVDTPSPLNVLRGPVHSAPTERYYQNPR